MVKRKTPKKIKVKTYKVLNPVYSYALFLRIYGTKEEALSWFDKKFECEQPAVNNLSAKEGSFIFTPSKRSHLLWFGDIPGGGLAAHEALHSVKHVLEHAGLGPLNNDTEEAYAYLLDWTVRQIGCKLW